MLFIMSRSTDHPNFPKYPDKFRIEDYRSCMVIKPYEDMKKPGLEFSLTYFDNPGVTLPSTVTTWVATRVMPDYLERLREATKNYKNYCFTEGLSKECIKKVEDERAAEEQIQQDKLDYCQFIRSTDKENQDYAQSKTEVELREISNTGEITQKVESSPSETSLSKSSQSEAGNFWKYLHPMYYFQ